MYQEYKKLDLPTIDAEIAAFWQRENIFQRSIAEREGAETFVFYEGPPSANGMPGIHHVMGRTIKDIFCRYQTLAGKQVHRKGGWDTHGLPVELAVEKELGITKEDIGKKISIADYNAKCRETVMRFKNEWDNVTLKAGYWVDLENPYITFESNYIESVWHLLGILYKKNLIYKGYTIQPYSPAAGTGLSSHEVNQMGAYQDVTDTTAVAMFRTNGATLSDRISIDLDDVATFFLAWTTTPWTLPSNTGLTVGPNIEYVAVRTENPYSNEPINVVLAEKLVSKWFGGKNQPVILAQSKSFLGKHIAGLAYEQLLPYGNEIESLNPEASQMGEPCVAFKVILGDFVTTSDGTGIVHTAPSFGADDRAAGKAAGIGTLTLVDKRGRFLDSVGEFSGEYVKAEYLTDLEKEQEIERLKTLKGDDEYTTLVRNIVIRTNEYLDVNERIVLKLQLENKLFKKEKYTHSYPHCWRTNKPILYYPLDSWFIRASSMRERMLELNQTINWKPAATGEGRFGKWLENLNDWNLSRSRYWGIPLPIWRTASAEGVTVEERLIASIAELQTEIERANAVLGITQSVPTDLHRPYIDDVILVDSNGQKMVRESDLIDVWFDSGAMPYAQHHYPFDNPDLVTKRTEFPADFIAEGVDQTRGWFYTLHAIATMCFDSIAYKTVISNGLVLDKFGRKMSKSWGNVINPFETIAQHGADVTRWYMITNAQPWDNLKFDLDGLTETRNKFFGTLYNTYNFFALYANADAFVFDEKNVSAVSERSELDRWVLSKLHSLIVEVDTAYAKYEPTQAGRALETFVDLHLSNWYVRLSRKRFWAGSLTDDKKQAYETLFECLQTVSQLIAPIAPFFADWLYKNLTDNLRENAPQNHTKLGHDSVHLSYFTPPNEQLIDTALEQRMDYAQRISSLVLSLRKLERMRVRQPLSRILLPVFDADFQAQVESVKALILQEVNIKQIEYITDTSGIVNKKVKPNFKVLGKKLGKNMAFAKTTLEALTQAEIKAFDTEKRYLLVTESETIEILLDEVEIVSDHIPGWSVANDGNLTVALDVQLTDELLAEGNARELVNRIQLMRKNNGLNITDTITITVQPHVFLDNAIAKFTHYIKSETLATELFYTKNVENGETIDLNDEVQVLLSIAKN